jgi:hypothetical protein
MGNKLFGLTLPSVNPPPNVKLSSVFDFDIGGDVCFLLYFDTLGDLDLDRCGTLGERDLDLLVESLFEDL